LLLVVTRRWSGRGHVATGHVSQQSSIDRPSAPPGRDLFHDGHLWPVSATARLLTRRCMKNMAMDCNRGEGGGRGKGGRPSIAHTWDPKLSNV